MMEVQDKKNEEKHEDNLESITASNPSKVIKYHHRIMTIDNISLSLILVSMKRSFLLTIQNVGLFENQDKISKDSMIRDFMNSNQNLKGLSLAIGDQSTCIINSDNSLDSATLASRLSRKLNLDRPVYVANNYNPPHETIDDSAFKSKLYLKIFQFVRDTYCKTSQA